MKLASLSLLGMLIGCGSGSTAAGGGADAGSNAGVDAGSDSGVDAGPWTVASHLTFPQMPNHGVPSLPRLQLVTITFEGYPYRAFVESFGDFVVGSQWLKTITQDYAPIAATHLAKVVLPAPAQGANADFGAVLAAHLADGSLPYPQDPAGLLYLVYAPSPCGGGGYHSWVTFQGNPLPFAVAFNCSEDKAAEGVASHGIAEALTDPFSANLPDGGVAAGTFFDQTSAPWVGEVGDICNFSPWWSEGAYRFLGIWSNAAAADGGSPCVPYPSGLPYFNVSPSPAAPQTLAAGSSVNVTLTGWSNAPMGPWHLSITPDNYARQDFDARPALSSASIGNGTTVTLTLQVPAGTPSGAQATIRVHSGIDAQFDGVGGFSNDWSLQVSAR